MENNESNNIKNVGEQRNDEYIMIMKTIMLEIPLVKEIIIPIYIRNDRENIEDQENCDDNNIRNDQNNINSENIITEVNDNIGNIENQEINANIRSNDTNIETLMKIRTK
ncbi:unnamed protein product [Rhizophagus irregularis]|nr:unnamed protein product [Rhizophagus irregularis]